MEDKAGRFEPSPEIKAVQEEIVGSFQLFDDWTDRYQYIIDVGRSAPAFPDEWRIDKNKLDGCQSQVWMVAKRQGDRLHYEATSDSAIVSGLVTILLQVYSDRCPEDIIMTPPDFIEKIELAEHLSPTRSNGLHAMMQQIRRFAVEAMAAEDD